MFYHYKKGNDMEFVDMMDVCGGTARVSQVLVRRRHIKVGHNFDAVVGFDLLDSSTVASLWAYIQLTKPIVVVMSTPCTGLKGWVALNRIRAPEAVERARSVSIPLGRLGAKIAKWQLDCGRHLLAENPKY